MHVAAAAESAHADDQSHQRRVRLFFYTGLFVLPCEKFCLSMSFCLSFLLSV